MVNNKKIKLSKSVHDNYGRTSVRIEFPNGNVEHRNISTYDFNDIGITKVIEGKLSEGNLDYSFTPKQWEKITLLIPSVT